MSRKKFLMSALLAVGTLGTVTIPLPSGADVSVQLNFGPPPERVEVIPAPRRGYIWTPGYWDWRGNKHIWVRGHWIREREGYAYQPHRWAEREGRWSLERGRWERAHRDTDRDGVPDRFDRRPRNPNRS